MDTDDIINRLINEYAAATIAVDQCRESGAERDRLLLARCTAAVRLADEVMIRRAALPPRRPRR